MRSIGVDSMRILFDDPVGYPTFLKALTMNASILAIVPLVALLTACGGGGSGDSVSNTQGNVLPYSVYIAKIQRIKATVTHALNNEASIGSISASPDNSPFLYEDSTSLSTYVVDDGLNSMSIDTSAVSAGGLYSETVGDKKVYVGGTTWDYSRYGFMVAKTSNSNGANTEYTVRNTPFARVQQYTNQVVGNATYNLDGSKAVGTFVTTNATLATVICNVSVVLATSGVAQTADFTVSGCDNSVVPAGTFRATKTGPLADAVGSNGTTPFTTTTLGNVFTPTDISVRYRLGGPNAEEVVGTVYMTGNTMVGDTPTATSVSFAFGARK